MSSLHQSLFSALLATPERGLAAAQRSALSSADEGAWSDALTTLAPHKVAPLLCHQLRQLGLLEKLPAQVREQLTTAQRETQGMNMLLFLTAATILRHERELEEPPLVLKGILLADSYYPELSTRPMGDIDFVAAPGRYAALRALLGTLGFDKDPQAINGPHSETLVDARGLICDAHRCIQEFIGFPWEALSQPVELKRFRGVAAQALKPEAMLAHLALHMYGHRPEIGLVLLWLLDVAFVVRRHPTLSLAEVRRLCRNDGAFALLLRILQLLARHGEVLPEAMARATRTVPPLTLGAILRQRRFTPWGLPGARGVARVVAHKLALKRYTRFPEPHASDFLLWPLDALALRVSPLLVRVR